MRIDASERFAFSFISGNTQFRSKTQSTFRTKKVDTSLLVTLHWSIQNSSCTFNVPMFFQACERAESSKSCNLIGYESGRYFTILPAIKPGWNRWQLHSQVCLLFVNEQKPWLLNHIFFQTCAIISISNGKGNFIFQTKNVKEESSKPCNSFASRGLSKLRRPSIPLNCPT